MVRRLPLDAIDSRVVLTTYAIAIGATGFFIFAWGTLWLGGPLLGNPWGLHSVVRVIGAIIGATACSAWGLSRVKDPTDRRRGLTWFLIAHGVTLSVSVMQASVVWGKALPQPAYWALVALASVTTTLFYGWMRQTGDEPKFSRAVYRLFGEPQLTPSDTLRSQYEAQLRVAGAREERHRFARDLHDSVKQQVFAIQTAAATAEVRLDTDLDGARDAIRRIRDAGRDAMAEMDAMLDQLRIAPADTPSLIEAVRRQIEACGLRTGAEVRFERQPLPASEAWSPGSHDALFRASQEALNNVARHARARHVTVRLYATPFHVVLEVEDDGSGFDLRAAANGMGLDNIRGRITEVGGTAEVVSLPGRGTRLAMSVPYEKDEPAPFVKKALFAGAIALFMLAGIRNGRSTVTFIILAAPTTLDALRYLVASLKARRQLRRTA